MGKNKPKKARGQRKGTTAFPFRSALSRMYTERVRKDVDKARKKSVAKHGPTAQLAKALGIEIIKLAAQREQKGLESHVLSDLDKFSAYLDATAQRIINETGLDGSIARGSGKD